MAENYIVINGKKAELTPAQLKALGLEKEIKNPFERAEGQKFYFIDKGGSISDTLDEYWCADNEMFEVANYCTDREMMEQRALHETLNRLLWRYSMEHGGREIDWSNRDDAYRIAYDYTARRWEPYLSRDVRTFGTPYFATMEVAYSAIVEIIKPFKEEHPDFKL